MMTRENHPFVRLCVAQTQRNEIYARNKISKRKRLTIGAYLMRRTLKNMKYVHCFYTFYMFV